MPLFLTRCALLFVLIGPLLDPVTGLTLPFEARLGRREGRTGLQRRQMSQVSQVTVNDIMNVEYSSTITVGGTQFNVTLDTGSSDLNIFSTVPTTQDTNIPITVPFAQGSDSGVMSFATVEFAGYTVPNQIYNHILSTDPVNDGRQGLLGLGPSEGSVLHGTIQESGQQGNAGDALLDRIFQQDTSSPNFMTFSLSREDSSTDTSSAGSGIFTIGDVVEGNENILNMPQLDVVRISPTASVFGQHWAVQLDGVIGNDGNMVTLAPSGVSGTPSGKAVVIFDTGFTLPQVSEEVTNAFYADIPGAQLVNVSSIGELWTMPCDQPIQGAFIFSGQTYPIHPLDLNADPTIVFPGGANPNPLPSGTCFGFFQTIQEDAIQALGGAADMILGMAFLRNVYALMNYGDFVDSSADATMPPYVQLLSTTNQTSALAEFNAVRVSNGVAGSASSGMAGPTSTGAPAPVKTNGAGTSRNGRLDVASGIALAILAVMSSS